MKDFQEQISHGSEKFPAAAYKITKEHMRYNMAFHWHPEQEILYLEKGKFNLVLDGETYELNAGDVYFIQGGTFHQGEVVEECKYYCYVFKFEKMIPEGYSGSEFANGITQNTVKINRYLGKAQGEIKEFLLKLNGKMFENQHQNNDLEVTGLFLQLMGFIYSRHLYSEVSQPTEHTVEKMAVIRNVISLIEKDYSQPLSLEDMAEIANLTPQYFCRMFKKLTKRSPVDYLIAYRIDMAEYLLRTTNRSITEIAMGCGFNDVSHFTRYFKREKGVTPKQYRIQINNQKR